VRGLDSQIYLTALPFLTDLFAELAIDHPLRSGGELPNLVSAVSKILWSDALTAANNAASNRNRTTAESESQMWYAQATLESEVFARINEITRTTDGWGPESTDAIAGEISQLLKFDRFALSHYDRDTETLTYEKGVGIQRSEPGRVLQFDHEVFNRNYSNSNTRIFDAAAVEELSKSFPGAEDLDHSRMTQVLNNLISNASKFSPVDSTVTVTMDARDEGVMVEVSDEGTGIDSTEADAVFDPFYRIAAEAVKKVPGTGLGLHVARTIVRQHRGDITIVDCSTTGTTLRVTLPLVR